MFTSYGELTLFPPCDVWVTFLFHACTFCTDVQMISIQKKLHVSKSVYYTVTWSAPLQRETLKVYFYCSLYWCEHPW
jgi:hypothetical protein